MHRDQMMQNQQIVHAFEELALTPAQIADQFSLEELAVKSTLMQFSKDYRKRMDSQIDYNLTDKEAFEAKETLVRLMRDSPDEHLQFKVAKYILDDKKGRLDIGKNMASIKMDVTVFNQYLTQSKDAIEKSLNARPPAPPTLSTKPELIDV